MRLKTIALAAALVLTTSEANAQEFILCMNPEKKSEVVVTLSEFKRFGHTFNCVKGEFVVNLSGCAPNGAFGLHAPTGSASLLAVVGRWQEYSNHLGGITSNYVTPTEVYFSGGFNSPSDGFKEEWSFRINRLTGEGALKSESNTVTYACESRRQKF
jgi:hypothetical protein